MRLFAILAFIAGAALAQGPGDGELRPRAPTPPTRDAGTPSEPPALKVPAVPESAAAADSRSRRAAGRCDELSGELRSQCLLEQQGAGAGATSAPEPPTGPPPQNPR